MGSDRHDRGSGRTSDEPLAASRDPEPERAHRSSERGHRAKRRWWSLRGWRLYAVPALVVLTALAVLDYSRQGSEATQGTGAGAGPARPVVTESPHTRSFRPDIFAAALPPGEAVPETGAGTFDVLPGGSAPVGQGKLYRYTTEVESGVRLAGGNDTFGHLVQQTLSSPRSWTNPKAGDVALQRVDARGGQPDFRVTLVSKNTARQVCGYGDGVPFETSCRVGDRVYINAARWVRGAIAFQGDMGLYRQYAINHEVGHFFGNGHVPCGQQGGLAPVMMQQTLSTANDDLADLNDRAHQGGEEIPRDGLVCKPNAWPFPLAGAGQ